MSLNIQRLKEEMLRCKYTQKELADMVGVTQVSMSRYLTGQRKPRPGIAAKMAKALGVTLDYLLARDIRPETGELRAEEAYLNTTAYIRSYATDWPLNDKLRLMRLLVDSELEGKDGR